MKTKHTAGPWTVHESHNRHEISAPNGIVVQFSEPLTPDGFSLNEADATLIAAAPDLLAACVQARGVVSQVIGHHSPGWGEATLKMLDEAIEKAGGR